MPKGRLQDGRLVYWISEVKPSAAEQLSELTGKSISWMGFLSKDKKKELGIRKDGFVLRKEDGDLVGLGRTVNGVVKYLDAENIALQNELFSGDLGEWMQGYPELLDPSLKNPSSVLSSGILKRATTELGYPSEKELSKDIVRIARMIPSWVGAVASDMLRSPVEIPGNATSLIVFSSSGADRVDARYILTDVSRIIPSHIPDPLGAGPFSLHPSYPTDVQERRYHVDPGEANKVRSQAKNFIPSLVFNSNPDAINGPPVVDSKNIVLGGNSRAMTVDLVYADKDKAKETRALLSKDAPFYGFTSKQVLEFDRPIIVRRVQFDAAKNKGKAREYVRLLNKSLTQDMDFASEMTAIASSLDGYCFEAGPDCENPWQVIASTLASAMSMQETTVNQYLRSRQSKEFLANLEKFGILNDRNRSKYLGETGLLNKAGRELIIGLFLGRVVRDPLLIDLMSDRETELVSSISPSIVLSSCCDSRWDISLDFTDALRGYLEMNQSGLKLSEAMAQRSLFAESNSTYQQIKDDPRKLFLLIVLDGLLRRGASRLLSTGFMKYGRAAAGQNEQQIGLFGSVEEKLDPYSESIEALKKAFDGKFDYSFLDHSIKQRQKLQEISITLQDAYSKTVVLKESFRDLPSIDARGDASMVAEKHNPALATLRKFYESNPSFQGELTYSITWEDGSFIKDLRFRTGDINFPHTYIRSFLDSGSSFLIVPEATDFGEELQNLHKKGLATFKSIDELLNYEIPNLLDVAIDEDPDEQSEREKVLYRRKNPRVDVSFELPASKGQTQRFLGWFNTETGKQSIEDTAGHKVPELGMPEEDQVRLWEASQILTASASALDELKQKKAHQLLTHAKRNGSFTKSKMNEFKTILGLDKKQADLSVDEMVSLVLDDMEREGVLWDAVVDAIGFHKRSLLATARNKDESKTEEEGDKELTREQTAEFLKRLFLKHGFDENHVRVWQKDSRVRVYLPASQFVSVPKPGVLDTRSPRSARDNRPSLLLEKLFPSSRKAAEDALKEAKELGYTVWLVDSDVEEVESWTPSQAEQGEEKQAPAPKTDVPTVESLYPGYPGALTYHKAKDPVYPVGSVLVHMGDSEKQYRSLNVYCMVDGKPDNVRVAFTFTMNRKTQLFPNFTKLKEYGERLISGDIKTLEPDWFASFLKEHVEYKDRYENVEVDNASKFSVAGFMGRFSRSSMDRKNPGGASLAFAYMKALGLPFDSSLPVFLATSSPPLLPWRNERESLPLGNIVEVEDLTPKVKVQGKMRGSEDTKPRHGDFVIDEYHNVSFYDEQTRRTYRLTSIIRNGAKEIEVGVAAPIQPFLRLVATDWTPSNFRKWGKRLLRKYVERFAFVCGFMNDEFIKQYVNPPDYVWRTVDEPSTRDALNFWKESLALVDGDARLLYQENKSANYEDITRGTESMDRSPRGLKVNTSTRLGDIQIPPLNQPDLAATATDLEKVADRLARDAEGELNSATAQQSPTRRRAGIVANQILAGEGMKKQEAFLRLVSESMRDGTYPRVLWGVRTSALLLQLRGQSYVTVASNIATGGNFLRSRLQELYDDLKDRKIKGTSRSLKVLKDFLAKSYNNLSFGVLAAFDDLKKKAGSDVAKYKMEAIGDEVQEYKRMYRAGLQSSYFAETAMVHIGGYNYRAETEGLDKDAIAAKKAQNERTQKLIAMNIKDFHPTPQNVIEDMLDLVPWESLPRSASGELYVLEPSAGAGDIVESIRDAKPSVPKHIVPIERNYSLSEMLREDGFDVRNEDFLLYKQNFNPEESPLYGLVVMNPPFSKGQDGIHIQAAYDLLAPGGFLVAIAGEGIFGRSDKKSVAFREWLEETGAEARKLPENSFKSSFHPTGVATRLVWMTKPIQSRDTKDTGNVVAFPGALISQAKETGRGKSPKPEYITMSQELYDEMVALEVDTFSPATSTIGKRHFVSAMEAAERKANGKYKVPLDFEAAMYGMGEHGAFNNALDIFNDPINSDDDTYKALKKEVKKILKSLSSKVQKMNEGEPKESQETNTVLDKARVYVANVPFQDTSKLDKEPKRLHESADAIAREFPTFVSNTAQDFISRSDSPSGLSSNYPTGLLEALMDVSRASVGMTNLRFWYNHIGEIQRVLWPFQNSLEKMPENFQEEILHSVEKALQVIEGKNPEVLADSDYVEWDSGETLVESAVQEKIKVAESLDPQDRKGAGLSVLYTKFLDFLQKEKGAPAVELRTFGDSERIFVETGLPTDSFLYLNLEGIPESGHVDGVKRRISDEQAQAIDNAIKKYREWLGLPVLLKGQPSIAVKKILDLGGTTIHHIAPLLDTDYLERSILHRYGSTTPRDAHNRALFYTEPGRQVRRAGKDALEKDQRAIDRLYEKKEIHPTGEWEDPGPIDLYLLKQIFGIDSYGEQPEIQEIVIKKEYLYHPPTGKSWMDMVEIVAGDNVYTPRQWSRFFIDGTSSPAPWKVNDPELVWYDGRWCHKNIDKFSVSDRDKANIARCEIRKSETGSSLDIPKDKEKSKEPKSERGFHTTLSRSDFDSMSFSDIRKLTKKNDRSNAYAVKLSEILNTHGFETIPVLDQSSHRVTKQTVSFIPDTLGYVQVNGDGRVWGEIVAGPTLTLQTTEQKSRYEKALDEFRQKVNPRLYRKRDALEEISVQDIANLSDWNDRSKAYAYKFAEVLEFFGFRVKPSFRKQSDSSIQARIQFSPKSAGYVLVGNNGEIRNYETDKKRKTIRTEVFFPGNLKGEDAELRYSDALMEYLYRTMPGNDEKRMEWYQTRIDSLKNQDPYYATKEDKEQLHRFENLRTLFLDTVDEAGVFDAPEVDFSWADNVTKKYKFRSTVNNLKERYDRIVKRYRDDVETYVEMDSTLSDEAQSLNRVISGQYEELEGIKREVDAIRDILTGTSPWMSFEQFETLKKVVDGSGTIALDKMPMARDVPGPLATQVARFVRFSEELQDRLRFLEKVQPWLQQAIDLRESGATKKAVSELLGSSEFPASLAYFIEQNPRFTPKQMLESIQKQTKNLKRRIESLEEEIPKRISKFIEGRLELAAPKKFEADKLAENSSDPEVSAKATKIGEDFFESLKLMALYGSGNAGRDDILKAAVLYGNAVNDLEEMKRSIEEFDSPHLFSAEQFDSLKSFGLSVKKSKTEPSRKGKAPRDVWIVEGYTKPYEDTLRDLDGRRYKGKWSFWSDPSDSLLKELKEQGFDSFETARARKLERSEARSERYEDRAIKASQRSQAAYDKVKGISKYMTGEPIKVGHHSERRHRRDIDRMDRYMRKSIEEDKYSDYLESKAKGSMRTLAQAEDPTYIKNRIKETLAELRSDLRSYFATRLRYDANWPVSAEPGSEADAKSNTVKEEREATLNLKSFHLAIDLDRLNFWRSEQARINEDPKPAPYEETDDYKEDLRVQKKKSAEELVSRLLASWYEVRPDTDEGKRLVTYLTKQIESLTSIEEEERAQKEAEKAFNRKKRAADQNLLEMTRAQATKGSAITVGKPKKRFNQLVVNVGYLQPDGSRRKEELRLPIMDFPLHAQFDREKVKAYAHEKYLSEQAIKDFARAVGEDRWDSQSRGGLGHHAAKAYGGLQNLLKRLQSHPLVAVYEIKELFPYNPERYLGEYPGSIMSKYVEELYKKAGVDESKVPLVRKLEVEQKRDEMLAERKPIPELDSVLIDMIKQSMPKG